MKSRAEPQLSTSLLSPGDLVDEREAAAILNIEVRTLRNWRALSKGPCFVKVGERMVRYRRCDLNAFVIHAESDAAK